MGQEFESGFLQHRVKKLCSSGLAVGPGQIGLWRAAPALGIRRRQPFASKKQTAVDPTRRPVNQPGTSTSRRRYAPEPGRAPTIVAADRGGRVAPTAAYPSQATGCVKRRDNQLHRARVQKFESSPLQRGVRSELEAPVVIVTSGLLVGAQVQ
jgi:hypothetical protein